MVDVVLERTGALVADRKVVLLTGASGRIGSAFCEKFADTYDIVGVRHRRPLKVATQLQRYFDPFDEELAQPGDEPGVFEVRADLRETADVARVIELALARFGRIDAVVNAIGTFDRGSDLLGAALNRVPELFQVNVVSPMAVATGVAVEYWRHHDLENAIRHRVVINISAAASVDSADRSLGTGVGACKAALNLLSIRLAEELQPFNVRVVTIAPAPVPDVVTLERVTAAIASMIEGEDTGRLLLMWDDDDELV